MLRIAARHSWGKIKSPAGMASSSYPMELKEEIDTTGKSWHIT